MQPRLPRFAVAALAVAGFLAYTPRASADYILDGFDTPAPGQMYQIAYVNGNPYTSPATVVSPGVSRTIEVMVNSPTPPNFNSVSGTIGGGKFTMDTDNESAATSTVRYALTGAASDLSGATGLILDFRNLNPGNNGAGVALTMPVTVTVATATGTLTSVTTINGSTGLTSSSFDFGSFSGGGDLSRVNSISFAFNDGPGTQTAVDFSLDAVRVKTVPAPPAVLLAGVGVLALMGRARLTRRKPIAA